MPSNPNSERVLGTAADRKSRERRLQDEVWGERPNTEEGVPAEKKRRKDELPVVAVWGRSSSTSRRCGNDTVDVLKCSPPSIHCVYPHVWCSVSTLWHGGVRSWKPAQPRLAEMLQSINQSINQPDSVGIPSPVHTWNTLSLTHAHWTSYQLHFNNASHGRRWLVAASVFPRRQPRSRKTIRCSVRTALEPPVQTDLWWSRTLGGGFSFTSGMSCGLSLENQVAST